MALQRLKDVAEKAKCELSAVKETEINLPFIISTGRNEALHLQTMLSRDKLEELTSDLIDRTIEICARTLEESEILKNQIEDVILVGGMTRMPRVQQACAEFFGLEPCKACIPTKSSRSAPRSGARRSPTRRATSCSSTSRRTRSAS
jgi:molecular chaperone DnaK